MCAVYSLKPSERMFYNTACMKRGEEKSLGGKSYREKMRILDEVINAVPWKSP